MTSESYASVFSAFEKTTATEIVVERNGKHGFVALSESAQKIVNALDEAPLADLLRLSCEGITNIERAAIYRTYGNRVYYDEEPFVWTGSRFERFEQDYAEEVVLLSGNFVEGFLKESGATRLILRKESKLDGKALDESSVNEIVAEPPYFTKDGALYLSTPSGNRLIAALPCVEELTLSDCAFYDDGALYPCERITSLTIPFAGNTMYEDAQNFQGEAAPMFGFTEQGHYRVPATLQRVTVLGGKLISYAFYGFHGLKEVVVCGVKKSAIARTAFTGLSLDLLHTPRKDVLLQGDYTQTPLPCGCALFTKTAV